MLYNASGQENLTVVNGSVYTGLQAADGSWNIVINNGSTTRGLYHPCGAFNAVVVSDPYTSCYAPNGSIAIFPISSNVYSQTPVAGTGVLPNLLPKSNGFTTWTPTALTVTAAATTDPLYGTTTASSITDTAVTSQHIIISQNIPFTSGTTYTYSVYAKFSTSQFIQLYVGSGVFGANAWANYDIQNGVLGTTGTSVTAFITNVGNGWYRIGFSAPATSTASAQVVIGGCSTSNMTRGAGYLGTGITSFVADAQVVAGTSPGYYVNNP